MNDRSTKLNFNIGTTLVLLVAFFASGCAEKMPPSVVVYTLVERETARPIFAEFTQATGIKVRAKYADELGDVAALAQTITAQRDRNRCDLFWDNEILTTLRMEQAGLLRNFTSPVTNAIASDARVLIVNTRQVAEARRPKSIQDLTDPQWYERVGIARPLTGPAATHAACLFVTWGDARAQEFFRAVKRNARILANDRDIARAVATGSLAFGLTSASAASAELAADAPVAISYPDQAAGDLGTLFIPSTVALLKDSAHAEPAAELLNYLLSPNVARRLADGPDALVFVQTDVASSDRVKSPTEVRAMQADFHAATRHWDTTAKFLQAEFTSGN